MRHRGPLLPYDPERKVRTPQHVIADLSYNFLERKVLQRGHSLDTPRNDYGIDATMFHHDEHGQIENGEVRFQLKSSAKLQSRKSNQWIAQRVDLRDVRYWYFEPFPVIVISYDADFDRAYWLHVQSYVDTNLKLMESAQASATFRIPMTNKLTLRTIDEFRRLSLKTQADLRELRERS